MVLNLTNIIPIIIVFQGLLFVFFLFTYKGPKKVSNRILAFFLFFLVTLLTVKISVLMERPLIRMRIVYCVLAFVYGPLLYLYSTSLIYEYFSFKRIYILHFLPSVLLLINVFVGYPIWDFVRPLAYLSLFPYLILAIREILKYRKIIQDTQSIITQTDLSWLLWTMIIFCFVVFFDLVEYQGATMLFVGPVPVVDTAILISVNWMFYKGLRQPQIFLGISRIDESIHNRRFVYEVNHDDAKSEIEKINKYMKDVKPFIDSHLSLKNLATKLQIPSRKLSYLINQFYRKNFMTFINDYRLEFAEERLKINNESSETILEVMYDSGFHSKSSFNTLFKHKTGLTPTEYRKKYTSH